MVKEQTPASRAKFHGLASLTELSEISGVSMTTLKRWFVERPDRFDLLTLGCVVKKLNYSGKTLVFLSEVYKSLNKIEEGNKPN